MPRKHKVLRMRFAERHRVGAALPECQVAAEELEYIAFTGQQEIAHGIFRSIPIERRSLYYNKFILSEVINGGVKKLRNFLAASAEVEANEEKAFLNGVVDSFVEHAKATGSYPRELFASLLVWGEELTRLSLLREALRYYDEALALGIKKFPELHIRCVVGKGNVLTLTGKIRETQSLLAPLAERPYIIPDRNLVPEIVFRFGTESLLKGEVALYKSMLFRGLRHFYTDLDHRRAFVDQIRKTYRYTHRVLLDSHIRFADKLLFLLHRVYFALHRRRLTRLTGLASVLRYVVLGYVYFVNYVVPSASGVAPARHRRRHDAPILITRAMGGIGDLLMMTPALHALKQQHPSREIHLALPKRYFPLFYGNTDVTLVDIENDPIDHSSVARWHNLTDCPAARVESRTAPRVKKSRIELFARGIGVRRLRVKRMDKRPRYFVLPEEQAFQQAFWSEHGLAGETVIAVQLHADEVYRDYPNMPQVVAHLARTYRVLVFDAERIPGYDMPNVIKVEGLPMRKAFALVAACNAVVAPDSAFVHLAAAFDLPCVGLFGPVDGKVRTMHYPKCTYLDARARLGCVPCWRNDKIPCKLTGMRASVCLADIAASEIYTTVTKILEKEKHP